MKVNKLNKLLESIETIKGSSSHSKSFVYKTEYEGEPTTALIKVVEKSNLPFPHPEEIVSSTYEVLYSFLGRPVRYSVASDEIYWFLNVEIEHGKSFDVLIQNDLSVTDQNGDLIINFENMKWEIYTSEKGFEEFILKFLEEGISQNRTLPQKFYSLNKKIDLE